MKTNYKVIIAGFVMITIGALCRIYEDHQKIETYRNTISILQNDLDSCNIMCKDYHTSIMKVINLDLEQKHFIDSVKQIKK